MEELFDVGLIKPSQPASAPPKDDQKPEIPDPTTPMVFEPPVAGATISQCGKYRYKLWRRFKNDGKRVLFICANPSIADAEIDDPTLNRMIAFAKREDAGLLTVVNLFSYRTPYHKTLRDAHKSGVDIVGPENLETVRFEYSGCDLCVAAWGNAGAFCGAGRAMIDSLDLNPRDTGMMCLGKNGTGHPRHPLYVPGNQRLEPFSYALDNSVSSEADGEEF